MTQSNHLPRLTHSNDCLQPLDQEARAKLNFPGRSKQRPQERFRGQLGAALGEEEEWERRKGCPAQSSTQLHSEPCPAAARGLSSHPGGVAGEKTLRTKAHEPDFGAAVRMPVRDSAEQSREPSKRVPGEQAGAARRAPTPARSRRQSGTLQHAVMSFRSLCTCKHGWCGAAGTLHFLLTARLHLAGFLPEKVRLLLSSLCDLEPTLTSLCRFLRKRCAPWAFP